MTIDQVEQIMAERASAFGRSEEEEWLLAAEAWIHSGTLAACLDPHCAEYVGPNVSAFRELALTQLHRLFSEAYPDFITPDAAAWSFLPPPSLN